jgi:hypothetical protein
MFAPIFSSPYRMYPSPQIKTINILYEVLWKAKMEKPDNSAIMGMLIWHSLKKRG